MKNIFFTIIILLSYNLFSQSSINPTTLEEYKYMTIGYKTQIEGGLDPKVNYEVVDLISIERDTYVFEFKPLFRKTSQELAGIIVIANSKTWGNKYFLGIPVVNNDTTLLSQYEKMINSWDEPMTTAYAKACSLMYSVYLNGAIECQKKR